MNPYEEDINSIVEYIKAVPPSNLVRGNITNYLARIIQNKLPGISLIQCGSSCSRTYLPDSDLDLILFYNPRESSDIISENIKYLSGLFQLLCEEIYRKEQLQLSGTYLSQSIPSQEFTIRNIEFINARTKLLHCLINNVNVDITMNQLGSILNLLFFEQVDQHIQQNHLFKRSLLLIKCWCLHESILYCSLPILASKEGMLSSYALSVLVLYLFNKYGKELNHPLHVLRRFLSYYSSFSWETTVVTIHGPQPIVNGSNNSATSSGSSKITATSKAFQEILAPLKLRYLNIVTKKQPLKTSSNALNGNGNNTFSSGRFSIRSCNIQDPIDENNNLGISVSRQNLVHIKRALLGGHQKLEYLLTPQVTPYIYPNFNTAFTAINNTGGNGNNERRISWPKQAGNKMSQQSMQHPVLQPPNGIACPPSSYGPSPLNNTNYPPPSLITPSPMLPTAPMISIAPTISGSFDETNRLTPSQLSSKAPSLPFGAPITLPPISINDSSLRNLGPPVMNNVPMSVIPPPMSMQPVFNMPNPSNTAPLPPPPPYLMIGSGFIREFFPFTFQKYMLPGIQRSDLLEHPLQLTHMRLNPSTSTVTPSNAAASNNNNNNNGGGYESSRTYSEDWSIPSTYPVHTLSTMSSGPSEEDPLKGNMEPLWSILDTMEQELEASLSITSDLTPPNQSNEHTADGNMSDDVSSPEATSVTTTTGITTPVKDNKAATTGSSERTRSGIHSSKKKAIASSPATATVQQQNEKHINTTNTNHTTTNTTATSTNSTTANNMMLNDIVVQNASPRESAVSPSIASTASETATSFTDNTTLSSSNVSSSQEEDRGYCTSNEDEEEDQEQEPPAEEESPSKKRKRNIPVLTEEVGVGVGDDKTISEATTPVETIRMENSPIPTTETETLAPTHANTPKDEENKTEKENSPVKLLPPSSSSTHTNLSKSARKKRANSLKQQTNQHQQQHSVTPPSSSSRHRNGSEASVLDSKSSLTQPTKVVDSIVPVTDSPSPESDLLQQQQQQQALMKHWQITLQNWLVFSHSQWILVRDSIRKKGGILPTVSSSLSSKTHNPLSGSGSSSGNQQTRLKRICYHPMVICLGAGIVAVIILHSIQYYSPTIFTVLQQHSTTNKTNNKATSSSIKTTSPSIDQYHTSYRDSHWNGHGRSISSTQRADEVMPLPTLTPTTSSSSAVHRNNHKQGGEESSTAKKPPMMTTNAAADVSKRKLLQSMISNLLDFPEYHEFVEQKLLPKYKQSSSSSSSSSSSAQNTAEDRRRVSSSSSSMKSKEFTCDSGRIAYPSSSSRAVKQTDSKRPTDRMHLSSTKKEQQSKNTCRSDEEEEAREEAAGAAAKDSTNQHTKDNFMKEQKQVAKEAVSKKVKFKELQQLLAMQEQEVLQEQQEALNGQQQSEDSLESMTSTVPRANQDDEEEARLSSTALSTKLYQLRSLVDEYEDNETEEEDEMESPPPLLAMHSGVKEQIVVPTHWIQAGESITFGHFASLTTQFSPLQRAAITDPTDEYQVYHGQQPHGHQQPQNGMYAISLVQYLWMKDGNNLTTTAFPIYSIEKADYADAGTYECYQLTSDTITFSSLTLITRTIIGISKKPKVTTKPFYHEVTLGHSFYFQLDVDGLPYPHFRWYKNGYPLLNQSHSGILIEKMDYYHAGTYTCEIWNIAGDLLWLEATLHAVTS